MLDCKHFGIEQTKTLKERFLKYYETKFKNSNNYFSYQANVLACTFYSKNKPNMWLVDSKCKENLCLDIVHFDARHTRYTPQTILQILNTFDLQYCCKLKVFYLSALMLIPLKRVLQECGFFVKRQCNYKIQQLKSQESCVLAFCRENGCYVTQSTLYLKDNLKNPQCLRNPFIKNFGSNGYVLEEDLCSFVFMATFSEHVNVNVILSKKKALQMHRDIDPTVTDLSENVSASPFNELEVDACFKYIPLDLMNRETNFKRSNELDACQIVIDKYIALNGEFDKPAKATRHWPLAISSVDLKRLKEKDAVIQRKLRKEKALLFGNKKNEIREKKVSAIRDDAYWLAEEKADANFKEALMERDIEIKMNSTPSFMPESCISSENESFLINF